MKYKTYIAVLAIFACITVASGVFFHYYTISSAYEQAIELIQSGQYESALKNLEAVNRNTFDSDEFVFDMKYGGRLSDYYKNSGALYAYALAQKEYNSEGKWMGRIDTVLDFIPQSYDGEFSNDIRTFKGYFEIEYENYMAEQIRIAEEREKAIIASYANKFPYEGMSEKYIDCTLMGKHHEYKSEVAGGGMRWEHTVQKYYWENIEGDTMLYVDCVDGVVRNVIKYGVDYFWTADGRPIYSAVNPHKYSYKKKSKKTDKKEDPYDVYEYSDAEDFYYDHEDDFWDYYDAEDYYDDAWAEYE